MVPVLPIAVLALAGLAYWKATEKEKKGMTAERKVIFETALAVPTDATKLRQLGEAFKQEGLQEQGELLEKRANLRELPAEVKEARREVFKAAMQSPNVEAVKNVAEAFAKEGATGAAKALTEYAKALPTQPVAENYVPPIAYKTAGIAEQPKPTPPTPIETLFQTPTAPSDVVPTPATYLVKKGDFPWKITQAFVGNGARWKELIAANPSKPTGKDGNFKSLQPGETLILPLSWPKTPKGAKVAGERVQFGAMRLLSGGFNPLNPPASSGKSLFAVDLASTLSTVTSAISKAIAASPPSNSAERRALTSKIVRDVTSEVPPDQKKAVSKLMFALSLPAVKQAAEAQAKGESLGGVEKLISKTLEKKAIAFSNAVPPVPSEGPPLNFVPETKPMVAPPLPTDELEHHEDEIPPEIVPQAPRGPIYDQREVAPRQVIEELPSAAEDYDSSDGDGPDSPEAE